MEKESASWQADHEQSLVRKLIESPFILLILSLLIVFTSYAIWGSIELLNTPKSTIIQSGASQ